MNNPATFKYPLTLRLDADPRQSGFPYSTLGTPFRAEKAQVEIEAGGTAALGRRLSKKVKT
jgi:hypothetical protein